MTRNTNRQQSFASRSAPLRLAPNAAFKFSHDEFFLLNVRLDLILTTSHVTQWIVYLVPEELPESVQGAVPRSRRSWFLLFSCAQRWSFWIATSACAIFINPPAKASILSFSDRLREERDSNKRERIFCPLECFSLLPPTVRPTSESQRYNLGKVSQARLPRTAAAPLAALHIRSLPPNKVVTPPLSGRSGGRRAGRDWSQKSVKK